MHSKRRPTKVSSRRYHVNMTVTTVDKSANPAPVTSLAVIGALVIAALAVFGVSTFYWNHGHVLPTASASVSHQASGPRGAAPANLGNQGNQFLFELQAQGIAPSGDGTSSVNDAHSVCQRYQQGESEGQIVDSIVAGTPSMSKKTANDFANTAISVYCR
jgi:hypothetical protein